MHGNLLYVLVVLLIVGALFGGFGRGFAGPYYGYGLGGIGGLLVLILVLAVLGVI